MKVFRLGFVLIALTLMTGCTAVGPLYSEVATSFPPVPEGKGRIYFYRPDTIVGAAVTSDITLNGRVVGKSERAGFFFADEDPGKCTVTTSTEVEKQLTFVLEAGETKYVKTTISIGVLVGRIQPELVSNDEGSQAITKLHYTGGKTQ